MSSKTKIINRNIKVEFSTLYDLAIEVLKKKERVDVTPETIHSKLDGVVPGVTSAGSFFNDDSGKSTEQQNRTPWNHSPCQNGYNDIHIVLNEIHIPNFSESAYQHLRPAFQSWDKNVGSIDQTPSPPK